MMRTRSRSDKEKQGITGHSSGAGGMPSSMLQASGGAMGGPSGMYCMYMYTYLFYLVMLFLANCSVTISLLLLS